MIDYSGYSKHLQMYRVKVGINMYILSWCKVSPVGMTKLYEAIRRGTRQHHLEDTTEIAQFHTCTWFGR